MGWNASIPDPFSRLIVGLEPSQSPPRQRQLKGNPNLHLPSGRFKRSASGSAFKPFERAMVAFYPFEFK
jgi:hypothetical protein